MDTFYSYIKKHWHIVLLLFFCVIGFIIRLYKIQTFPPVDIDEYGVAYNAYSILHYGVDEWGVKLPLFFKSFGDYKLPLDIYLVVFFYKILGENFIALRLPSILFGVAYIPTMYLLMQAVTKDKKISLISAAIMVFAPYNLYFSRVISASISQSYFITASVTAFVYYLQSKRTIFLYIFMICLGISLYTYPAAWIISPLLYGTYIFISILRNGFSKHIIILTLLFALVMIPIAQQYISGGSTVRVKNVGFFGANRGVVMEIDEFRAHDTNTVFAKALHNKAVHYAYAFLTNYVRHFDLSYLLMGKYELIPQHSIDPPIFAILIPLYYLGLILMIKKINWVYAVILIWILIAPIPSAITEGAVNSKRYLSFMGSETVVALIALQIFKIDKHKYVSRFIFMCIIIQAIFLTGRFYTKFVEETKDYIYFKANILYQVVRAYNTNTDTFVYSFESLGEPQIYPLVAANYSPLIYNKQKKYTYEHLYVIAPFDKYYYSKEMVDIKKKIAADLLKKKRVLGVFADYEKKQLSTVCFDTLTSYPMPITQRVYYLLQFKPCSS